MPSSKYPNQIDTSVELPTVRDNITEIGSDVLNSFKSSILAIEKTLGVNPHGSTGNTVASRINRTLDANGDLLASAITQAGILSGPITNNEVSDFAAIDELKLNLNFPTKLLQDEISILQSEISQIEASLSAISAKFSAHINPAAINRHKGISIDMTAYTSVGDNIATMNLEAASLQDTIQSLYNAHINYTGLNLSSTNNSHSANQIYFNNQNIQDISTANDLQTVIEDLSGISGASNSNSNLNLNSNGLIRAGSITDGFEANNLGPMLAASSSVTYTQSSGQSRTTFVFSAPVTPSEEVTAFDTLILNGSAYDEDNICYEIASISLSGSDIISVDVFGGPKYDSVGGLTASIYKNIYRIYNPAGLLSSVRPRINKTNTPDIQIANPNSAAIISYHLKPEWITSSANTFDIAIDGGAKVTIETYDSNVSFQTIDSIVNKINEQAVDYKLNFAAYKYRANKCYEIALVHLLPNFLGDSKNRTLSISAGTTNDGTTQLGLSSMLDKEVEGTSGNPLLLNGYIKSIFGKIQVLTGADIEIVAGTQIISTSITKFVEYGIRNGDIIIIEGSSDSNDDGCYRVNLINGFTAEIDSTYNFAGALDENSKVYLLRSTAPVGEMTFEEILSGTGDIVFDVFMNNNVDIFYSKRLEIDGTLQNGPFIGAIIDISKDFVTSGETATLTVDTDGTAYITGPDGNPGTSKFVASPGDYKLFAADGFSFITLRVGTVGVPVSQINVTCYGFNEVGRGGFPISRGTFSTTLGRVIGYPSESGIPAVIDKRRTGTVDETVISESLLEKYIQGPANEIRASGIIQGFEIGNVQVFSGFGYTTYDIGAGVAFVNGIRIEFPGILNNRVNTENDFYIAIDPYGCIVHEEAVVNPDGLTADNKTMISPFHDNVAAHIASIELQQVYDLRMFIDRVDYKILDEIIVSNQKHFGHFDNISDAVAYAKRFTEMFPDSAIPKVKIREGVFEISSPIIIDFDLEISGCGKNTHITKSGGLATGSSLESGEPKPLQCVFYIGNTSTNNSDRIIHGVSISDMTYKVSSSLTNVGSFINIAEAKNIISPYSKSFEIKNIIMEGPSTIGYNGGGDGDCVGEYFVVAGFADTTTYIPSTGTYENIKITNCVIKKAGIEYGPCYFRDLMGMTYSKVFCSGNIGMDLSPVVGDTSFDIFEVPSSATLSNVMEVNNIIE